MFRHPITGIVTLAALVTAAPALLAQTSAETSASAPARTSMCAHLASSGRVVIHQDARLEALIAPAAERTASQNQSSKGDKSARITTTGYRIRIFSGNNQTASKTRAQEIQREIAAKFPDIDLYVYFKTPNWRLTAGNFRTSEEAYAQMAVLKKEFPRLGREMFIVRDEIELPE